MLIKFTLQNYKTFRDKVELSMIAANHDKLYEESNVCLCTEKNLRLLRSVAVYGANASGKSKLMEALQFMRIFILASSRESQKGDSIPVVPFMLSTLTSDKPSEFEIIFMHKNEMYRYGFEVTTEKVVSEWLFHRPKTKEVEIFYRENQSFELHSNFSVGKKLVDDKMIRDNALLLSVAAQFNDTIAGKVFEWTFGFRVITALETIGFKGYSAMSISNPKMKDRILQMLHKADISIKDLELRELELDDNKLTTIKDPLLKNFLFTQKKYVKSLGRVIATHDVYDADNNVVGSTAFDLEEDESSGTNQFFDLTGPIIDVIENGWVLAVDELDSKLHPKLVEKIVEIFNSKELNPKNAQLIFNTHDTNLLRADIFRRDQVWFVEKDRFGAASLYSLADFKSKVRKGEHFEKNYIRGKYGAIPVLNDLSILYKTIPAED